MIKKFLNCVLKLLKRNCCENCVYCTLIHNSNPIYLQYIHTYKRSNKKKIKRKLIGFTNYTSVNCSHPETQDKWAPYLRDIDYLMMSKPFKCCFYKRRKSQ